MFNWFKKNVSSISDALKTAADEDSIAQLALRESKAQLDRGNAFLESGKLVDAAECYRQAIAKNPSYADACTNLGYVLQVQGNLDEAVALYRKAIEFNPNLLMAHQNLGFALMSVGQSDAAEASLRRVITLAPEHTAALHNLAMIAAQRGDFPQAETLLRRSVELQPDYAEAHNNLGKLFKQARRFSEAEASYRRVQELQPDNADAHYSLGTLFMELNRLPEAEACYRRTLELAPDFSGAYNNLALLLVETGHSAEAEALYRRVLELKPDYAEAHYSLGVLLAGANRLSEAEACYRRALELKPDFAKAHNNLALLLVEAKRLPEAEACYRRLLELNPDNADAHYNLGTLFAEANRLHEAEASYRRAMELKPDFVDAYRNLAVLLKKATRLSEAEALYRRALELEPDFSDIHNYLGVLLLEVRRLPEAETSFRRALELKPDYIEAHYNLGIVLKERGQFENAVASYRQALEIKPDFAEAHNNMGFTLQECGKTDDAVDSYRRALEIKPDFTDVYSNLLLSLSYTADHAPSYCLEQAREFGRIVAGKVAKRYSTWRCEVQPERLRVGLVSGDLRTHPVAFFLEGFLSQINPAHIELFAYSTNPQEDELTSRIRPYFAAWKSLSDKGDEDAANMIHADGVHVLCDISGHTGHNRLQVFAWKPAPVQVSWLGYWNTTGMAEIDYLLADKAGVPEDQREQFTESIWYLPDTRLCFTAPETAPSVASLPALSKGVITFGCFQNLSKVGEEVLAVWGEIFAALPSARLRIQCKQLGLQSMEKQMLQRLQHHGIDPARFELHGEASRKEYLAAHAEVDIILDTFPFAGGTTSCEALWMGVPTLTLAGEGLVARQGASILTAAGLDEWIAENKEDYIAKAIALSGNLVKLSSLRAGLRQQVRASPLFDAPRFARNFESAMDGMWQKWREQHDAVNTEG